MPKTPLEMQALTSREKQTLKIPTVTAIPSTTKDNLPRVRSATHNHSSKISAEDANPITPAVGT